MNIINDEGMIRDYINKFNLDILDELDLKNSLDLIAFEAGEYLYKMADPVDYFYYFVSGKAKVFTTVENGRRLLLRFYEPLMLIGDLEFASMKSKEATTNIMALTPVHCLRIPMDILEKIYLNDANFVRYINRSLADKLVGLSVSSAINLLYPLENRLASYILYVSPNQKGQYFILDQLGDIAELLGTSYRHLLRTFKLLSKRDVIQRDRNKIKILDYDYLQELAGNLYQ